MSDITAVSCFGEELLSDGYSNGPLKRERKSNTLDWKCLKTNRMMIRSCLQRIELLNVSEARHATMAQGGGGVCVHEIKQNMDSLRYAKNNMSMLLGLMVQ